MSIGVEYFLKSVNLVKVLLENKELKNYFFDEIYLNLIELCQVQENVSGINDILSNLFLSFTETQGHAYCLTEIIIKMHEGEP
jgi:hypothetical protein